METNEKPVIIGVSGGKGGTGKTFVATNIAVGLAREHKVLLIDTDVDNPNASILLGKELKEPDQYLKCFFPKIDSEKCTSCGKCADNCRFHAFFHLKDKIPQLIEPLCKSCELCMRICPENAINPRYEVIGEQFFIQDGKLDLLVGRLMPGSAKTTLVIIDLKKYAIEQLIEENEYEFVVIDTAPGAHCDVEHSLDDVDKVICVTEPTPLGRHDLDRILQLCEFIKKDSSIVLNRSDMADYDEGIQEVATEHKSEIISRIPLSRDVMETYARGIPIMAKRDKYGLDHPVIQEFDKIISIIKEMRKNG